MSDVIDLEAKRAERIERDGRAAHARGEAFACLELRDLDDTVSLIDGDLPVVLMPHPDCPEHALEGFAMTRETARRIGQKLLKAADTELPALDAG